MSFSHARRLQCGIQCRDAGHRVIVDISAIDGLHRRTARQGRSRTGGIRIHIRDQDVPRRCRGQHIKIHAIAGLDALHRQRLPGRGRVGEVELVHRGTRGRGRGRLQQRKVIDRRVLRRIQVRYLVEPQIQLVRPAAQEVVLVGGRALDIRIGDIGDRVGTRAGTGALRGVICRRQVLARNVGGAGCAATGAGTGAARGRTCGGGRTAAATGCQYQGGKHEGPVYCRAGAVAGHAKECAPWVRRAAVDARTIA